MYAIVDIAGKQYRVEEKEKLFVSRLDAEVGNKIELDNVLLVEKKGDVSVGKPRIEGASVKATVIDHVKADKVVVFKKKRRKGYRVKRGHRQPYTQIEINTIKVS